VALLPAFSTSGGGIGSLTFHMQGGRASLVAQLHEILALWNYRH